MSTTSRGYPLYALTDSADVAAKLNAIAQAVNDDLNANVTDTGWQPMRTLSASYTASVAQCRVKNGELQVRGAWTRKSGFVTVGDTVFGLPVGMFPTGTNLYRIPFVSSGTVSGFLALDTTGIASVVQISGSTTVIVPATVSVPMD